MFFKQRIYNYLTLFAIMYIIISKNIKIIGNKTSIQANVGAPALQIRLRTQVQNNTYKIFIIKIIIVLGTLQLYDPKQYVFV